jgi:uncharacterized repeat protein (TIGR01451 family)
LGGSITSQDSTANTVYIPAGSETNTNGADLGPGDTVTINIGGTDYTYTVDSVTPGTPASTVGNVTTAEVPTALVLSPLGGSSPIIAPGTVPSGTQIGETQTVTVTIEAGEPSVPGTSGTHDVILSATASAPGPVGEVVTVDDVGSSSITVLSGEATLDKFVRNVSDGSAWADTGITARTGDELEYRLTAGTIPGETVTGATMTDFIPDYTTYVEDSTTLNGVLVADVPDPGTGDPTSALVLGISVNSPSGGAGEIVDGETAVILFRVIVQ